MLGLSVFILAYVRSLGRDVILAKAVLLLVKEQVFCKHFLGTLRLGTTQCTWLKTVQRNTVAWIIHRSTSGKVT